MILSGALYASTKRKLSK